MTFDHLHIPQRRTSSHSCGCREQLNISFERSERQLIVTEYTTLSLHLWEELWIHAGNLDYKPKDNLVAETLNALVVCDLFSIQVLTHISLTGVLAQNGKLISNKNLVWLCIPVRSKINNSNKKKKILLKVLVIVNLNVFSSVLQLSRICIKWIMCSGRLQLSAYLFWFLMCKMQKLLNP